MTHAFHVAALASLLAASVPDCSSNVNIGTVARSCDTPVEIVSGLDGGVHLVYQNGTLFWGVQNPAIVSMPLAGGKPKALTTETGAGLPMDMKVAGDYVYWGMNADVKRVPIEGGAPTLVAVDGNSGPIIGIALDAESVYWSTWTGVSKAPVAGGPATVLAPTRSAAQIALDDAVVYWTDCALGTVNEVPKAGGTPVVLASGRADPIEVAVGGDSVYWLDSEGTPGCASGVATPGAGALEVSDPDVCEGDDRPYSVMKVSKLGGAVTRVASAQIDAEGFAVDTTYIYWLTTQGDPAQPTGRMGRVMRAPLAGGPAEAVATLAANWPTSPTLCPGGLCWNDDAQGASGGSVWRLALTCK